MSPRLDAQQFINPRRIKIWSPRVQEVLSQGNPASIVTNRFSDKGLKPVFAEPCDNITGNALSITADEDAGWRGTMIHFYSIQFPLPRFCRKRKLRMPMV